MGLDEQVAFSASKLTLATTHAIRNSVHLPPKRYRKPLRRVGYWRQGPCIKSIQISIRSMLYDLFSVHWFQENPKATRKPQVGRLHPLFSQLHSRNNSIATMSSSPMQTPMHGTPQQQQQIPSNDLPPMNTMPAPIPQLNIAPREHENPPTYMDHSVFNAALNDPTNPYGGPARPPSSHDVLPSFTHHPHPMWSRLLLHQPASCVFFFPNIIAWVSDKLNYPSIRFLRGL